MNKAFEKYTGFNYELFSEQWGVPGQKVKISLKRGPNPDFNENLWSNKSIQDQVRELNVKNDSNDPVLIKY